MMAKPRIAILRDAAYRAPQERQLLERVGEAGCDVEFTDSIDRFKSRCDRSKPTKPDALMRWEENGGLYGEWPANTIPETCNATDNFEMNSRQLFVGQHRGTAMRSSMFVRRSREAIFTAQHGSPHRSMDAMKDANLFRIKNLTAVLPSHQNLLGLNVFTV